MNVSRVLSAYGFKNGYFDVNQAIVTTIDASDETESFAVEGNLERIDSAEEFITAAYFSPVKIENISVVDKVLPHNTTGIKDLYVMWKMKATGVMFSSMEPALKKKTLANYDLIEKSILTKGGVSVADAEAYYAKAVAAEVDRTVTENFSKVNFDTTDNTKTKEKTFGVTIYVKEGVYEVTINNGITINTVSVSNFSELSKYGFSAKQIQDCVANAGNIPSAIYGNAIAFPQDERNPINAVSRMIKDYLIAPDETKFNTLASLSVIYLRYMKDTPVFKTSNVAFINTLSLLNSSLCTAVGSRIDAMSTGRVAVAFVPPTPPSDLTNYMFPLPSGQSPVFRKPTVDGRLLAFEDIDSGTALELPEGQTP